MKKKLSFVLSLVLFLLSAGVAGSEEKVNKHPYELGNFPLVKTDHKGNVYTAYYSKDGGLYIRKNKGEEVRVSVENGKGTFVDLTFFGDDIVLTWRPKLDTAEKFIYVQRSTDGGKTFSKPVVLNTTTHALPPVHVADDGKNRMYVVWVDERKGHNLYMNYSQDKGKTFMEKDINLTPDFNAATLPYILIDGESLRLFFVGAPKGVGEGGARTRAERQKTSETDSKTEGKEQKAEAGVFYMQSKDSGKTWSNPLKVQGLEDWTPALLNAVKTGDNVVVFWAGVKGIYGASSKDGSEWKHFELKETGGQDVARLNVAADGKGALFLSASWKEWGSHYTVKQNTFFYRSEDHGNTWLEPRKLNTNEYGNTTSYLPAMHVRDNGTILVAWQDHRDIRGDIYINYSKDSGKTWLEKDINIEKTPGKDNSFFPHVVNHGDKYYMLWIRYADDRMSGDADIYMEEFTIADLKALDGGKPSMSKDGSEKLLRERVADFWVAMVKREREKVFELYDPFYRIRETRAVFTAKNHPIFHFSPETVGVEIKGNVATVKVRVEYEVKGLKMRGKDLEQPRKETVVTETWIFIDGNWYKEYIDQIMDATTTPY